MESCGTVCTYLNCRCIWHFTRGGVEKTQGIQPLLMYSSYVSCCIVSFCFRTLYVWLKRCENKLAPCCGCKLVLCHWGCVVLELTTYFFLVSFISKEARDINLDAEWSRRSQFLALLHERRVGYLLHPVVRHSRAVGNPRQKLDLTIKNLIGPNMEPLLLGLQRTLQNFRPFHWCCACLSLQYDAIGHATGPKTRRCGSSETHTGSMGLSVTIPSNVFEISGNVFQKEN